MPTLTHELANEYQYLWNTRQIDPDKRAHVQNIVNKILSYRSKYEKVENKTDVPWAVIATIHSLESGLNFNTHLHNGDPLTHRTVHVPAGRPLPPLNPPFSWEESAIDALKYDGLSRWKLWDVPGILYKLEGYNGFGYRNHDINSPYLWAGCNHYFSGKYVSDGKFDKDAVSKQIGAACILGLMQYQSIIEIDN